MHQIKLFCDIESNEAGLEERVNVWLRENSARVINIFGNIAPQTTTIDAKAHSINQRSFASSDLFIAIVYEVDD